MVNRKSTLFYGLLILMSITVTVCCVAPRTTMYVSGSLEHIHYAPALADVREKIEREEIDREDIDYYKYLLEQKFQLSLPGTIVVLIPTPRYLWYYMEQRIFKEESLYTLVVNALQERMSGTEFVKDIKRSSSLFKFNTIYDIQEIAARHRADEALLMSYNLNIIHPTSCCGLWPLVYLRGELSSEIALIDTRTGFILLNNTYSLKKEGSKESASFAVKEQKIIHTIVDEWTESITNDILDFFKSEVK